jgi:hypothetical protein
MRFPLWLQLGVFLLAGAIPAQARVGVTSETDGDPLGKPPTQDERVLRVGIDIQADELITTRDNDRAHLVFLDGTSLTIGPNARLKVDHFVYDPASRTGDLAVTVSQGVFRLVGGRISKTTPIVVNTPTSTIGIRGGIGLFSVDSRQTISRFLFGSSMTVTALGRTVTATRPGSQIATLAGGFPGAPGMIPSGALANTITLLEARPSVTSRPGAISPDQNARSSGFSAQNSGKGPSGQLPAYLNIEGIAQTITATALSQSRDQVITNSAVPPAAPSPATVVSTTPTSSPPSPTPPGPVCIDDDHFHHRHHQHHHFDGDFRR